MLKCAGEDDAHASIHSYPAGLLLSSAGGKIDQSLRIFLSAGDPRLYLVSSFWPTETVLEARAGRGRFLIFRCDGACRRAVHFSWMIMATVMVRKPKTATKMFIRKRDLGAFRPCVMREERPLWRPTAERRTSPTRSLLHYSPMLELTCDIRYSRAIGILKR